MCGITGIVDLSGQRPQIDVLTRMNESLAHRGPDDSGYHVAESIGLANRRLAILDLSPMGHQPMGSDDGLIWVVQNGEIFNYIELAEDLRRDGVSFRGTSDTEVVLRAYERYGPDFVSRLNGMFAIALWDGRNRRFLAARDRLGIKPLYYWFDQRQLIFGSEIKALLRHPNVRAEPEDDSIRDYLLFGHQMRDTTWFRGIKSLPPGSVLSIEDGCLRVEQYWDLTFDVDYSLPFEHFRDELSALLEDAVRLHLRSDVPTGAYLSGGIDSSAVVALAARELGGSIKTFSASFPGYDGAYDEQVFARLVVDRYKTQHSTVQPLPEDLPGLLPELIRILDEPVIGAAVLPMYRVSELVAKSGVKVVAGGQGGDELFGGYPPYFVSAARSILRSLPTAHRAPGAEVLAVPSYLSRGGAFERLRRRVLSSPAPRWLRISGSFRDESLAVWKDIVAAGPSDPFESMTWLNIKHYLPGLLHQEDRMSMAWSIESRVPLLDYRVVELAMRIPSWYKIRRGVPKAVLREALRSIVPDAVLNRRDKKGYPVPSSEWFAGPLAEYVTGILAGPLLAEGFVNPAIVSDMINAHVARRADFGAEIWKVLNLELWLRGVSTCGSADAPGAA